MFAAFITQSYTPRFTRKRGFRTKGASFRSKRPGPGQPHRDTASGPSGARCNQYRAPPGESGRTAAHGRTGSRPARRDMVTTRSNCCGLRRTSAVTAPPSCCTSTHQPGRVPVRFPKIDRYGPAVRTGFRDGKAAFGLGGYRAALSAFTTLNVIQGVYFEVCCLRLTTFPVPTRVAFLFVGTGCSRRSRSFFGLMLAGAAVAAAMGTAASRSAHGGCGGRSRRRPCAAAFPARGRARTEAATIHRPRTTAAASDIGSRRSMDDVRPGLRRPGAPTRPCRHGRPNGRAVCS